MSTKDHYNEIIGFSIFSWHSAKAVHTPVACPRSVSANDQDSPFSPRCGYINVSALLKQPQYTLNYGRFAPGPFEPRLKVVSPRPKDSSPEVFFTF